MDKIKRYKTVYERGDILDVHMSDLENQVNYYIKRGWQPLGHVVVNQYWSILGYYQSLVHEDDKDWDVEGEEG